MRKILLLLLTLCTLGAKAQFQNPFKYEVTDKFWITSSVIMSYINKPLDNVYLPQDTILPLGFFQLNGGYHFETGAKVNEETHKFLETLAIDFQLHDYYNRTILQSDDTRKDTVFTYRVDTLAVGFIDWVKDDFTNGESQEVGTDIGGHYYWSWTANNGIKGMSGHVQLNHDPSDFVWGQNGTNQNELIEYNKLSIYSKFNTGFPYDIAKYQGKAKYTIYNPDSVVICQKEIDLRISPDSTMNSQIQKDLIFELDSALHGKYQVLFEAPFLDKPKTWTIEVVDPLAAATSKNPVSAAYRFAESNFKESGKGKGWKYTGSVKPTYYTDEKDPSKSVMVVRPEANGGGNAFSLTQSVSKMPQGFYKLKVPVAYQPCKLTDMQDGTEILVSFEANGYTKKGKNILAGAVIDSVKIGEELYTTYKVPNNDKSFAENLPKNTQEILFEVKEDSIVRIGVHKSHTDSIGEITAIGAIDLLYYGAGLPYADVAFPQEKEFAPGDSIKTTVQLHDGVGCKVFAANMINIVIGHLDEQGKLDSEHLIHSKQLEADKSGFYDLSFVLPADKEYQKGDYMIYVSTLMHDDKYECEDGITFKVKGATGIQEVKGTAYDPATVYNLSGVRQSKASDTKGVYIQGGKKYLKK